jgi:hypothetical protein
MIKLENGIVVVYYHEEDDNSEMVNYKIDLSNRKHYIVRAGDELVETDWCAELSEYVESVILDSIPLLIRKIENNRNVIHSYTNGSNERELTKAKRHFDRNVYLLQFARDYAG